MPRRPPPVFEEGLTLEWPLVSLEPFLFIARAALERLCLRLEERGLACLRLDLSLHLEPEGYAESSHTLPAPTRDPKTLLTLVRLNLEAGPPGAPVQAFTFIAHPDRPREAQLSLFGPTALPPDRLATTLARLFALLGPEGVGSPRPVDGHRPEAFQLVSFEPPPPPRERPEPQRGRGLLAIRVLRPPVEVEVITAGGPEASRDPQSCRPLEVHVLLREEAAKRPRVAGQVRVASGPWVLEEEWWEENPTQRSYWDVELTDGGLYRLFRDAATGRWFTDGVYD
jgi:protein ImuB